MEERRERGKIEAPGTLALVFIFLAWFVSLYFLNWSVLARLWNIR
jgi:hypothetical protein